MWQRWSRLLEALGRLRVPMRIHAGDVSVGDPTAPDAAGGDGWKDFQTAEALFRVWGPLAGSPWEPYHAVPLFAALDRVKVRALGPTPLREVEGGEGGTPAGPGSGLIGAAPVQAPPSAAPGAAGGGGEKPGGFMGWLQGLASTKPRPPAAREFRLPAHVRPGAPPPDWAVPGTLVVVDLPGRTTVEAAAWLVVDAGLQPVCTFDHWPHRKGLLRAERVLAELLRWASTLGEARGRIATDAPPLWICDATRLGTFKGSPGEFDNRYYLDDSILPAPAVLRPAGIERVVYLGWGGDEQSPDAPGPTGEVPVADLVEWFTELLGAGIEVLHAPVGDPALSLRPFQAPPKRRVFSSAGYRRSAAGGFGTEIPEPSSSGSSG
jgi:hypothetical protein